MKENVAFLIQKWNEIRKSCNFLGMNIKKVKKLWTKESEHFTETLLYSSSYTNIENSPIYLILIWFSGKTWKNSGELKSESECYQMISGLIKRQDQQARER